MPWLGEPRLAPPRQRPRRPRSPPLLADRPGSHPLRGELGYRRPQVITHEKQLVRSRPIRGGDRHLRRRQREDQPSTTSINVPVTQHVTEEPPIGLGIAA